MRALPLVLALLVVTAAISSQASSPSPRLLVIDGVPFEHLTIVMHGEDGVIESGPGGLVAAAVGPSVALINASSEDVVAVLNLSTLGWGRTVSLTWARGFLVAVNSSCAAAVMRPGTGGLSVEMVTVLGKGLTASGAGQLVGGAAVVLCNSLDGPVAAVLDPVRGTRRVVVLEGLITAGNPVLGRGPLLDPDSGRVYFSGISRAGDEYVQGVYYLSTDDLIRDSVSPKLLYGVKAPSPWPIIAVRDVMGGEVLASINNTLVILDADGKLTYSLGLPWFYGDALFYGSASSVAVTFREKYDVEWVAVYDTRTELITRLFMRGSVLRLAVAGEKIFSLEPCVPGRDDYLGLYAMSYKGLEKLPSASVTVVFHGDEVGVALVKGLAPGSLHSWVSAYLDPVSGWWEAVYTTHIHYNGSLYNTVVEHGVGESGRAFLIDGLVTDASPVPGSGLIMAGPLVEPPSYTPIRQWYIVDTRDGAALTVLEIGADTAVRVQALSAQRWVSYGAGSTREYLLTDRSATSRIIGPGVSLAAPVPGSDYAVLVSGDRLMLVRVSAEGLRTAYSTRAVRVLSAAYNPVSDALLLVTERRGLTQYVVVNVGGNSSLTELVWPPGLVPVVPVPGGALAVDVRDSPPSLVSASFMGRVFCVAELSGCGDAELINYFISSGGPGVAIGCEGSAWCGPVTPPPPVSPSGLAGRGHYRLPTSPPSRFSGCGSDDLAIVGYDAVGDHLRRYAGYDE